MKIAPFVSLMFRRGWLLTGVLLISPMLMPESAYALSWDDLWLNQQQRAQKAFKEERYDEAEKGFSQYQWQGSAAYKNKNYRAALDAFSQGDTATDHYNKGNALSQLGKYEEAINAYDEALKRDPNFADAKKNKAIIESLKNQQQQGQDSNNQNNSDRQQNQENSSEDKQQNQQQNNQEQNQESDPSNSNQSQNQQQENQQDSQQDQQNAEQNQDDANSEQEPSDNAENSQEQKEKEKNEQQSVQSQLSDEEKQEIEQWIRKVPDDPSGLLRNKFQYEYDKRRQLYQNRQWELPDNNAHQRY